MRAEDIALPVAAWKAQVTRALARTSSFNMDWSDEIAVTHYLCELRESPSELLALFETLRWAFASWSHLARTDHRLFSLGDEGFVLENETVDRHFRR